MLQEVTAAAEFKGKQSGHYIYIEQFLYMYVICEFLNQVCNITREH